MGLDFASECIFTYIFNICARLKCLNLISLRSKHSGRGLLLTFYYELQCKYTYPVIRTVNHGYFVQRSTNYEKKFVTGRTKNDKWKRKNLFVAMIRCLYRNSFDKKNNFKYSLMFRFPLCSFVRFPYYMLYNLIFTYTL